jgi:hypothetical protein
MKKKHTTLSEQFQKSFIEHITYYEESIYVEGKVSYLTDNGIYLVCKT